MKDPAAREKACPGVRVQKQVHGVAVREAAGRPSDGEPPSGDGWVVREDGPVAGVYVADCQPLFLWEAGARVVGVFHSGWRGTADGMPGEAVRAMERIGARAERLSAAVGPHVGPCCYRVGPELRRRFRPGRLEERDGGLFLDLGSETRDQLIEAGVPAEEISVSKDCTACRAEDFFSFRRDKISRAMLAYIGPSRARTA